MNTDDVVALATRREDLAAGKRTGVEGLVTSPRLLRIGLIAALGGLNYGYEQGSYAQVLVMPSFTDDPRFSHIANDSSYKGWTVSTLALGGWLGALINGYFLGKLGRRWAICVASFVCLLGGALTTAAMNPDYIFAGRFFIGLSVGMMSTAVPTFLSELSPAEIRGTTVGLFQLAVTFGIFVSYWIGYGTSFISDTNSVSWRIPLAVQCIPAIMLMFGVWLVPESPRHLVNIGQDDKARAVLAYVRNVPSDDELTNIEFLEIKAESIFEKEIVAERYPHLVGRGAWTDVKIELLEMTMLFRSWDIFKRTATGGLTMFFQQWTGIDAIVNYAPTIFQSIGLTNNTTSLLASGVVGAITFVATFPALQWIDKAGRRTLMLAGATGMLLMLVLVSALSASFADDWVNHRAASWVTVVCIWVYIGNFAYSWGPTSWCVISEIFPLSLRGPGVAFSASSNWMNNFVVSYTVPIMLERIRWRTYVVFICTLFVGILWVLFLLPETRGKSLEEMDLVFHSHAGAEDIARMARIVRELGLRDGSRPGSVDEKDVDAAEKA